MPLLGVEVQLQPIGSGEHVGAADANISTQSQPHSLPIEVQHLPGGTVVLIADMDVASGLQAFSTPIQLISLHRDDIGIRARFGQCGQGLIGIVAELCLSLRCARLRLLSRHSFGSGGLWRGASPLLVAITGLRTRVIRFRAGLFRLCGCISGGVIGWAGLNRCRTHRIREDIGLQIGIPGGDARQHGGKQHKRTGCSTCSPPQAAHTQATGTWPSWPHFCRHSSPNAISTTSTFTSHTPSGGSTAASASIRIHSIST